MGVKGYTGMAEIKMTIPEDVFEISEKIRQVDRDECRWSAHIEAEDALWRGLEHSTMCWTGRINGNIACIFGVAPLSILGGVGIPWMLGTEELARHARTFLMASIVYVGLMSARYRFLENYVAANNTAAIKWLDWLGFSLWPARPYGPDGVLFHRFTMHREGR